ncbi:chromosome segregation protein sudA [Myriangium duriaei CBS 260.36]|uniref:Structural maintenance of chromosomes protein n=1 Tax=Myriangium duriaei CBS 260.36 TaxID=1168546 RepID=A0A9P4J5F0_9PEZI|nr:chromosome segregation protein sudA [Myriangium duriaei CBS 260.36]
MYIKQISIQGFKSYKQQTNVEPFSPKHNVVVGRNGSGKSNFFAAVRFVLGDAYTQMGREERQALLHEGSGSATMTAFVEIIFDNQDRRFPNGSDELILRRTIGQKKDEYSLDRKNATKKDVMSMLESAGFSRSNPYYIVPQGRVTALTNMKDSDRLNLLKEVAGTQVYESRRQESRRIMEETDNKRAKIDDLLQFIGDRLGELETEKEELKGFQEKDREKRCLEYTIFARDKDDVNRKLEEIDSLQQNGAEATEENQNEFVQRERQLEQIEQQINEVKQQIKFLEIDKKQYDDERKAAAREKAKIELELKSTREGQTAAQNARNRQAAESSDLQQQIQQREAQLQQLLPQYEAIKTQEQSLNRDYAEIDGRRQRLSQKQSRQGQFRNKRERDEWLRNQIQAVTESLATRKAVLMDANENITEAENDISVLDQEISDLRARLDNRGGEAQNLAAEVQQAADERDQLHDRRKDLRREEARLNTTISHAQQEFQKAERYLSQMMDRNTSRGLAAVRRIVKQHNIDGVYGILAELCTINDAYRTAAEVTAGTSLFHYVVDTDETASKILDILQREKAGRVTIIPLNRIRSQSANLPRANDAVPLLSRIEYDARFEPAFQQVFGKTIVCPNIQIAAQYARSHGVGAITPDGDRADKRGALTGGYHDQRRSRLEGVRNVAKWRDEYDSIRERLDSISSECEILDQQITRAISNLQKAEQRRQQADNGYGPLLTQVRSKMADLQTKKDELENARSRRETVEAAVARESSNSASFEAELASEFKRTFSDQEERELAQASSQAQDMRKNLASLSAQRSDLEVQKTQLEVELRENLRPRLDQIRADDAELASADGGNTAGTRVQQQQRQLKRASDTLKSITAKLVEIDGQIESAQNDLGQLESEQASTQQAQKDLAVQMHRHQKAIEKSASKRAMYTSQAQEVASKLRSLGVVPEAAFHAPYSTMRYDAALKRYHKVQEELKKYGHVNKKAFEQYNNFKRQEESLTERRTELETSLQSITDLIDTLDQRKDEAIERTFKQVSQEFSHIFEKLVPAGKGGLRIQRRTDRREPDDDDSDDEARRSGVENYVGVSIQVSFNSKHDEQQKIQQLSGGQKSLCALALVFAIQASDPAPFYLFDEIDANLDAQYRTAVAQMLHESAETGQFICTTFRPEMIHVADKCYGVGYEKKASNIGVVSREDALKFVEGQIGGK